MAVTKYSYAITDTLNDLVASDALKQEVNADITIEPKTLDHVDTDVAAASAVIGAPGFRIALTRAMA